MITVSLQDLDDILKRLQAGTHKIKITGINSVNKSAVGSKIRRVNAQGVFIDLSPTEIPPFTNLYSFFAGCSSLRVAPQIPDSVTNLYACFYGCNSLTVAPKIPAKATNLGMCFYGCSSLRVAPQIPDSVTNLDMCFAGCRSLEIVDNLQVDFSKCKTTNCFQDCTALKTINIKKSGEKLLRFKSNINQWEFFEVSISEKMNIKSWDTNGNNKQFAALTNKTLKISLKGNISELLFYQHGLIDEDIITHIKNKRIFDKGFDPRKKNFIFWLKNKDNFITNIDSLKNNNNEDTDRIIRLSGQLGEIRYFVTKKPTYGFLYANGYAFIPALYPEYYQFWLENFDNPHSAVYLGRDENGYPLLPDLRGISLRAVDDGMRKGGATHALEYQNDAIRNITGTIGVPPWSSSEPYHSGAIYNINGTARGNVTWLNNGNYVRISGFNASRVVPTAEDNRVKSRAVYPFIKVI